MTSCQACIDYISKVQYLELMLSHEPAGDGEAFVVTGKLINTADSVKSGNSKNG